MATDEEILARTLGRVHATVRPRRQPDCCTGRTGSGAAGARTCACAFRDHLLSDLDRLHLRVVGARRRGRRLRQPHRRRRRALRRRTAAGKRPPSSSSSTARTPGSTTKARAGRSCARSTAGSSTIPTLRTVTMAEACAGAAERLPSIHPGLLDQRRLLHLDRPRRRSPGLGPAGARRDGRSSTPPGRPARRRWRPRARSCSSPKAATGSGGTATTTPRTTTASSTTCSAGTCATSIARSACRFPRSCSSPTSPPCRPRCRIVPPTGPIDAAHRRRESSYFEWLGAGEVTPVGDGRRHAPGGRGRPAHRRGASSASTRTACACGSATTEPLSELAGRQGGELTLAFLEPAGIRVAVSSRAARRHRPAARPRTAPGIDGAAGATSRRRCDAMAEFRIPFERLGLREHDELAFVVTLRRSSRDVGRVDADGRDDRPGTSDLRGSPGRA